MGPRVGTQQIFCLYFSHSTILSQLNKADKGPGLMVLLSAEGLNSEAQFVLDGALNSDRQKPLWSP